MNVRNLTARLAAISPLLLSVFLVGLPSADAQNPDYNLRLTDAVSISPGVADVSVILDNQGGPVEAWSYSLCHDATVVRPFASQLGPEASQLNGGMGPEFYVADVLYDSGVRVVAVIDFMNMETLPVGIDQKIGGFSYSTYGTVGTVTSVTFCDTVGQPPTPTLVVVDVMEEVPVTTEGLVTIGFQDLSPPTDPNNPPASDWIFRIQGQVAAFDDTTGIGSTTVLPLFYQVPAMGDTFDETAGISCSVSHDPSQMTAVDVDPGPFLSVVNGGNPPGFFAGNLLVNGWTMGVVYDLFGQETAIIGSPTPMCEVVYDTVPAAFIGSGPKQVSLQWDILGTPLVRNVVVVNGLSEGAQLINGNLDWIVPSPSEFVRGDANADGGVDIADPISLIEYLFSSGTAPTCLASGDANSDGLIDVSDPIFIVGYLFQMAAPPGPPFPDCALVPSVLSCFLFNSCP